MSTCQDKNHQLHWATKAPSVFLLCYLIICVRERNKSIVITKWIWTNSFCLRCLIFFSIGRRDLLLFIQWSLCAGTVFKEEVIDLRLSVSLVFELLFFFPWQTCSHAPEHLNVSFKLHTFKGSILETLSHTSAHFCLSAVKLISFSFWFLSRFCGLVTRTAWGRQHWVWYRSKHAVNWSIFGLIASQSAAGGTFSRFVL